MIEIRKSLKQPVSVWCSFSRGGDITLQNDIDTDTGSALTSLFSPENQYKLVNQSCKSVLKTDTTKIISIISRNWAVIIHDVHPVKNIFSTLRSTRNEYIYVYKSVHCVFAQVHLLLTNCIRNNEEYFHNLGNAGFPAQSFTVSLHNLHYSMLVWRMNTSERKFALRYRRF